MSDEAATPERPTTGLRIVLERAEQASGASGGLRYAGRVLSPAETLELEALVDDAGAVAVNVLHAEPATLEPARRAALTEKVRLLVRSLVRQAATDDLTPPRRINRWRE